MSWFISHYNDGSTEHLEEKHIPYGWKDGKFIFDSVKMKHVTSVQLKRYAECFTLAAPEGEVIHEWQYGSVSEVNLFGGDPSKSDTKARFVAYTTKVARVVLTVYEDTGDCKVMMQRLDIVG